jgi:hypothetical protein
MLLDLPTANAAMQVFCDWEGKIPVAITVEGDASAFASFGPFGFVNAGYYEIEITNFGVWMLLNEPKPVLSVQMIGPRKPIDLALGLDPGSRQCWK